MAYDFKLACTLPAPPEVIYETWLDSKGHSAMTGGEAKMSKKVGADVSAWDGYITGKNIELVKGRRIVQSWRTSEFSEADPDSIITVTLAPTKTGSRLTLHHAKVPDGQTSYEKGGWQDSYFTPMKNYFAKKKK
ncbi:MAG TPA: SRPBCC domain-containing protein [Roseiarcus sp.]|nr:SRPBCC domain-containing protein [Roseiarcus sp.]